MTDERRPLAPLALLAGGLVWTGWSLAATVTGRVGGSVAVAIALSGLLLAGGLLALVVALPWPYRSPGGAGASVATLGALAFAVGQAFRVLMGDAGAATWLVAPGVLGLVAGSILLGVGLVRARRTPPWIGVGLLFGAVIFLGFDRSHALALAFGLAWAALGGHLWRHPDRPTDGLESSTLAR